MLMPLIYFVAELIDKDIDNIAVQIKVPVINMLGKLGPADNPAFIQDQVFQHRILLGGKQYFSFRSGGCFGVQVKAEIRERLLRYQRECFRVLWDAFKSEMLPELQEPTTDLTMAEKTLVQAEAFYQMARQQVAMERWLKQHDWRLDAAEDRLEDVEALVETELSLDEGLAAFKLAATRGALKVLVRP